MLNKLNILFAKSINKYFLATNNFLTFLNQLYLNGKVLI